MVNAQYATWSENAFMLNNTISILPPFVIKIEFVITPEISFIVVLKTKNISSKNLSNFDHNFLNF